MAVKYAWASALVVVGTCAGLGCGSNNTEFPFDTDGGPTGGPSDGTADETADGTDGEPTDDGPIDPPPLECGSDADAGGFSMVRKSTWLGDCTAAYSMIHDDMCGPALAGIHELAVPALDDRGIKTGLGPFIQACEDAGLWSEVESAQAAGHEIINHSYTHAEISPENASHEVADAKDAFDAELEEPVTFYIFPFDFWTPETLAAVESSGHMGARAGNRDDNDGFDNPPINGPMPDNDLEIEFDVWPRTYSKYASYPDNDILPVHVHEAVEDGGWAVREFHSVSSEDNPPQDGSQGFGPVPLSVFEDHLDFLVEGWHAAEVWTAPPSTVIRYRHAREACGASVEGNMLVWDAGDPECQAFHTPISVVVSTGDDVASIEAMQGGEPVPTRKLEANTFTVTADPTLGDVELSGCSDMGPEVTGALDAKPSPADSVCDLLTVTGTGMPGCMDDLERPPEEFQVLPNPSQCDGRDGSWSWYPQDVDVAMADDGGNSVLRYAGDNLGAWTGVTLAFLGGNGAGSCYDATAYTGIQFRIRGNVTSPDELNGRMILSVVTAETQTQIFGGDLDGEGGHFHQQVAVTADWQTIVIPFADLMPPTWGDSMSLTDVAVGKLQALDWGISNQATSFEVFIDDIELY